MSLLLCLSFKRVITIADKSSLFASTVAVLHDNYSSNYEGERERDEFIINLDKFFILFLFELKSSSSFRFAFFLCHEIIIAG